MYICVCTYIINPIYTYKSGALEMAARTRWALLGRSKCPLELARLRRGARNRSAWLLQNTAPADVCDIEPARLRWAARTSPLGFAGRARNGRSALLGRSKWPLELALLRRSARNCPDWLLQNTAPADLSDFEHARLLDRDAHANGSMQSARNQVPYET